MSDSKRLNIELYVKQTGDDIAQAEKDVEALKEQLEELNDVDVELLPPGSREAIEEEIKGFEALIEKQKIAQQEAIKLEADLDKAKAQAIKLDTELPKVAGNAQRTFSSAGKSIISFFGIGVDTVIKAAWDLGTNVGKYIFNPIDWGKAAEEQKAMADRYDAIRQRISEIREETAKWERDQESTLAVLVKTQERLEQMYNAGSHSRDSAEREMKAITDNQKALIDLQEQRGDITADDAARQRERLDADDADILQQKRLVELEDDRAKLKTKNANIEKAQADLRAEMEDGPARQRAITELADIESKISTVRGKLDKAVSAGDVMRYMTEGEKASNDTSAGQHRMWLETGKTAQQHQSVIKELNNEMAGLRNQSAAVSGRFKDPLKKDTNEDAEYVAGRNKDYKVKLDELDKERAENEAALDKNAIDLQTQARINELETSTRHRKEELADDKRRADDEPETGPGQDTVPQERIEAMKRQRNYLKSRGFSDSQTDAAMRHEGVSASELEQVKQASEETGKAAKALADAAPKQQQASEDMQRAADALNTGVAAQAGASSTMISAVQEQQGLSADIISAMKLVSQQNATLKRDLEQLRQQVERQR